MLLKIELLSFVTIFLLINEIYCECSDIRIRRNFESLKKSERKKYLKVFKKMYDKGIFEQLAHVHSSNFRFVHDYPQFLIWHRFFIHDFETRMMSIDPDLTLPYWDAANDFDVPHEAKVFSDHAFGGNGSPEDNFCLKDGFMADITVNYPWRHCIKRDFQGPFPNTIHPWHSPVFITSLIQTSSNYDEFRQTLEHSLHNSIHFSVGGFNGDLSKEHSPVDSLFFLHHANIDRIYAKWQFSHPHHLDSIDGHQLTDSEYITYMNHDYRLNHYNIRAGDLLRTLEEPLCYSYDDIVSVRPKLANAVEHRMRKLPKKLLKKYFPKFFAHEDSAMNHDFYNMRSLSLTLGQPLPAPFVLPKEFFEKMGFNVTRGLAVQERVLKFVYDMNNYKKRS